MIKIILKLFFLSPIIWIIFPAGLYADTGFFQNDWQPRYAPDLTIYTEVPAATGNPEIIINIHTTDTLTHILPTLFGNNTNPWLGKKLLTDEDFGLKHLRDVKISHLRLPGGNWTNKFLWDGTVHWDLLYNYLDEIKGRPNQSWTITADEMISLSENIGAEPQICVNLSLARYIPGPDSIEQAAHYAAEWVRHVNGKLGMNVRYWEVGNENYGDWQAGHLEGDILDGRYYGEAFRIFADSMKAADPTIKIGAVVVEQDNGSASGGYRWWMRDMLPQIQDKADYLVYHEYFTWKADINQVTVDEMIAALPLIEEAKISIENMVEKYTDKPHDYFPIAVTEFNVRAGLKDNQSISGIFIAMALAEFARNEYGLINLWDIANGYDDVTGDQGMLTVDHPTIRDYTPHPSFYTYYLYAQMCGDVLIESTPSAQTPVYSAATAFSGGEQSVLLVNPTGEERLVELEFEDFITDGFAYGYTVQSQSPTSEKIQLNGVSGNDFGPLDYAGIPLWRQSFSEKLLVNLPPWSVQFVLVTGTTEPTGLESNDILPLAVYPNPITGILYLPAMKEPEDINVFNISGELLLQTRNTVIDFSAFPAGIYLIKTGSKTARVIKY